MENFINLLFIIFVVILVNSITSNKLKISAGMLIFTLSYLSLFLINLGYLFIKISSACSNPILNILCGIAIIIIGILFQVLNYIVNINKFSFNNKVLYFISFNSLIPILIFIN